MVPPSDPAALKAALLRLATDDRLCARLGKQARERFMRRFTAERMSDGYLALYRSVLQDAPDQPAADPLEAT